MPDEIARPVRLTSEAYPAMRLIVDPTPHAEMSGVGGSGGSMATRLEHTTGYSHDYRDADGRWVATAHCSPAVAQMLLDALNAADPLAMTIYPTGVGITFPDANASPSRTPTPMTTLRGEPAKEAPVAVRCWASAEERIAHDRAAEVAPRLSAEETRVAFDDDDTPDDVTPDEVVAAVHEGRGERHGADVDVPLLARDALAAAMKAATDAGHVLPDFMGHPLTTGWFWEPVVRAVLAALGIEVREDA